MTGLSSRLLVTRPACPCRFPRAFLTRFGCELLSPFLAAFSAELNRCWILWPEQNRLPPCFGSLGTRDTGQPPERQGLSRLSPRVEGAAKFPEGVPRSPLGPERPRRAQPTSTEKRCGCTARAIGVRCTLFTKTNEADRPFSVGGWRRQ